MRLGAKPILIALAAAVLINLAAAVRDARSERAYRAHPTHGGYASVYGPGLYGNSLGCSRFGTLHRGQLIVASRSYRCGTILRICYRRRCVRALVADRGPYVAGRDLDLHETVAWRLCRCSWRRWGVRYVTWTVAR